MHAPMGEAAAATVTVVIPTRDRPELLRRAVRSVLGQQYAGRVECLVVVDSPDAPLPDLTDLLPDLLPDQLPDQLPGQLPDQLPGAGPRDVRALRNGRTPGLAGTRNTGYLAAEGTYLASCDDDDEWLPGKLTAQVALIEEHPGTSLVATGIVVHLAGRDMPRDAEPRPLYFEDFLADRRMEVHPSTYLTRRSAVVTGFGLVDEQIPGGYAEDYEWLLRAARTGPVRCVPQRLVRVHWHEGSFFTSRWQMIDEALTWLLERVPEFSTVPRGLGRVEGQLAFANAALGRRRVALGWAGRALRHHPTSPQAWASLPIASGLVSADRVVALARRRGRGV